MSKTNQIKLYTAGSMLSTIQGQIASSLRKGLMIEDIALEHSYTVIKAQHIYEGTYDPKDINPDYINPITPREPKQETSILDDVIDFFAPGTTGEYALIKTITGVSGFVLAGPIGASLALAGQSALANSARDRQIKEEIANAENSIEAKDEMIKKLYLEVVALRAELNTK